jgi:bacillopeptidase F
MDIGVAFSGGNRGPTLYSSVSPANNPGAFAVGAVDASLAVTYSSSRGPSACDNSIYPEVVAPGANIKTADLTNGGYYPAEYAYVSGTSFAAPHVAGAIGLLMNTDPSLGIDRIEAALAASALDLGAPGPDNDSGSGLLDVMEAYNLLSQNQPQCTDSDLDDFYAELDCGTPVDCDDTAAGTYPGACDIKGDGIDQDCDGKDRTKGKPCPADTGGGGTDPPPPDDGGGTGGVEGKGKTCSDGLDNDGDGSIDCGDPDCSGNKSCK